MGVVGGLKNKVTANVKIKGFEIRNAEPFSLKEYLKDIHFAAKLLILLIKLAFILISAYYNIFYFMFKGNFVFHLIFYFL